MSIVWEMSEIIIIFSSTEKCIVVIWVDLSSMCGFTLHFHAVAKLISISQKDQHHSIVCSLCALNPMHIKMEYGLKWNEIVKMSCQQGSYSCHKESCELLCISLEQQFAAFDGFFVRKTTTKAAHNSSLLSGEWCRWNGATVGRIWRVSAVAVIINVVHGHEFNHIITSVSRGKQ